MNACSQIDHLVATNRILKCLKGQPGQGIFMVGGNLISWENKKQVANAKSSAELNIRPWPIDAENIVRRNRVQARWTHRFAM